MLSADSKHRFQVLNPSCSWGKCIVSRFLSIAVNCIYSNQAVTVSLYELWNANRTHSECSDSVIIGLVALMHDDL